MKTATATKEKPASKPDKTKRIVIVDDHPLFRKGLEQLINSSDDAFAICGEAGDAAEGMTAIRQLKPDLAIVDLSLPGANGIELIKNIRAEFHKLPVLILSMHDESLYALRALRAGAQGYVMKQEALENVISAHVRLEVTSMFVATKSDDHTWTLMANGAGFRRDEAKAMAEERLIKQISTNAEMSLNLNPSNSH